MTTDVTPWCWTLCRKRENAVILIFHCAPGMAAALRKSLPDGASAYVRSKGRVRCSGRKFIGRFLETQGADPNIVRAYTYGRDDAVRRATTALLEWARGGAQEGGSSLQDDTI